MLVLVLFWYVSLAVYVVCRVLVLALDLHATLQARVLQEHVSQSMSITYVVNRLVNNIGSAVLVGWSNWRHGSRPGCSRTVASASSGCSSRKWQLWLEYNMTIWSGKFVGQTIPDSSTLHLAQYSMHRNCFGVCPSCITTHSRRHGYRPEVL